MAGEEMAKQISERRRKSRACSNLNVNFNGGGVVLLLGAAAGALLASAFAAHRIRSHKRRRGSKTEGIQGDSGEHLVFKGEKEFVGVGGARDGAAGEGVVQVNSDGNLDATLQISEVDQRESDFYLIEEGKGEVAERSPTIDIELVDGELAAFRESSADISSSPTSACRNLGENQLRYDDEELVVSSIKEECKISCINRKEDDDGEDNKKAYIEEWGVREEIEEKITSSNLYSEKRRLLEENSGNHLHPLEAPEFVEDEEEVEGGANTREGGVQANTSDDLHASLEILDFVKRESDIYLVEKAAERSAAKEIELVDGVEELACLGGLRAKIGSSPANVCSNLRIGSNFGEDQLRYDDEQLAADSVREESKTPCINSKEDEEEDNKKAYIEELGERRELEEKITPNLNTEELCLLEKKAFQNLEIVIAIEERKFEDGFKDEMYNSILEIVLSKAKEMATSSLFGDHDEMNPKIEEIEPFLEGSDEAKKALEMTQNDSGKHPEMVIMEDETRMESCSFKDAVRLDILCVEQDNKEGNASDDKLVEGSRGLCEQTVALPHESSVTAISEPEIEEDKKELEESNYPSAGVEGLIDEIQGITYPPIGSSLKEEGWPTESCICDNPAMIKLEDNATYNLNNVIQEEKTEENLLNGFKENVESSETEENLRENEECPLTESQGIEFSFDYLGSTHPPIRSPLKEEGWPTESCIHDNLAMIMAVEENIQLENNAICDLNDVIQEEKTEENLLNEFKKNVESSKAEENLRENEECPLIESQGIEFLEYLGTTHPPIGSALKEEGWPTESCIRDSTTMIMAVKENIQLENNAICDLNDVIQEEKTKENLLNGFKENVESSETKENLRENEECPLTESQGIEFSLEYAGTTHPPIGSSLKEEGWPTESYIQDNPVMIMAVEEKIQLENNVTSDLNDVIQEEKTEDNMLNGFKENVESSETEVNLRENEECPLTESQGIEFSLEQDNLMTYKESPLIQFQGMEPIVREEKACLEDSFSLSPELNMKTVQTIQDNNLNNSEKTLEIEECHLEAGAKELGTSPNEGVEKREDETISVQYHELESRQYIEADKDKRADKLENEVEYPQTLSVVKKGVGEIHKESQAQIKEEEEEEDDQIAKLSLDAVEKGVKTVAKTIKQDAMKHQRQVEGHENNVSSKGKQQRTTTKKVKGTEYMFMGHPKGQIYLVTTLVTAFAVLAFLYTKGFITRITILENFVTG